MSEEGRMELWKDGGKDGSGGGQPRPAIHVDVRPPFLSLAYSQFLRPLPPSLYASIPRSLSLSSSLPPSILHSIHPISPSSIPAFLSSSCLSSSPSLFHLPHSLPSPPSSLLT
jgi:hypothetical protein